MSKAHFRIHESLDRRTRGATVTIDRASGLFTIRLHRQRQTYSLSLAAVATMVWGRQLMEQAAALLEAKRRRARARRGYTWGRR